MIVLKRMNVPLYSSKYSKKTYTVHQHLLCLCIKEIQQQSYRSCRDFIDDFEKLQEILVLNKVPHFTTLQKSLQRFPPRWYKTILKRLIQLLKSKANAVIDGTGIMQTTASTSYIRRIKRHVKQREFFKIILVIDPDDGFILTCHGTHGHRHESPFFIQLFEDIPFELSEICGDKGFDSEKNQRYVMKQRHARSYVDVRDIPKRGRYRKKTYRQKQELQWKQRYKKMRNIIESKNFSFKHQFGDYIPGKNIHNRRRYLAIRIMAMNLITLQKSEKILFFKFISLEVFYTPPQYGYCVKGSWENNGGNLTLVSIKK